MGRIRFVVIFLGAWAISANAQMKETQTARCDDAPQFLKTNWAQLIANEPALDKAFSKIVLSSGKTEVTNCHITWPVRSGLPIPGIRKAVLDQQWYVNGRFQHHGLKIQYLLRENPGHVSREVIGFEVCRTPSVCKQMGIPAPTSPSTQFPPPKENEHRS